ncbi:MAG: hypothetical protein IPK82_17710 [Polyangiaceae bacterium]|nr:hypothetical protein [Polyangiaceae bacterium]
MSDRENLKTVDDAWAFFTARVVENIRSANRGAMAVESAQKDDEILSRFIQEHAGAFEERLIAGLSELAIMRWGESEPASALDELATVEVPGADDPAEVRSGPIDATLRALNPLDGLRLCWLLVWRHRVEAGRWAAEFFAERLKRAPIPPELPPELCDTVSFVLNPHKDAAWSLPGVLPTDLGGWSPRDIEVALEKYVGTRIEHIEARLRAGASTGRAILGSEERLGALIWQDAATLRALGVTRNMLADRLKRCVMRIQSVPSEYREVGGFLRWRQEWHLVSEIEAGFTAEVQWRGSWIRENPLHTVFGEMGIAHFAVRNPALGSDRTIAGCDLTIELIRRFCLFEGQLGERIDPETAARVLGLVP